MAPPQQPRQQTSNCSLLPSSLSIKGHSPPQFSAQVYCGQTAAWIKMPLGTEVGLGMLDGTQLPLPKKGQSPQFSAHVYCGQMGGWIKTTLGMVVGFGPGHIVVDRDPAPPPHKGGTAPQFSAQVYCGQTAGWIKMPLGMKVVLGPGNIVLDAYPTPPPRGTTPNFWPISIVTSCHKWVHKKCSSLI